MAENFSNFFISIAIRLKKKIPLTKKTFTSYLKRQNFEKVIIRNTTADEISNLMHSLKSIKSVGPHSTPPTNIIMISKK